MTSVRLCIALAFCGLLSLRPADAAESECTRACRHRSEVKLREFEKNEALKSYHKGDAWPQFLERTKRADADAMPACVSRCEQGAFDPRCVLAAQKGTELLACIKPTGALSSGGLKLRDGATQRGGLTFGEPAPGRPLAASEQTKILGALDRVSESQKLMLLGAALDESAGPMYGEDLRPAFRALSGSDPDHLKLRVISALQVPLVMMGCGSQVAQMMRLTEAQQGDYLAKNCPPPPSERLLPAGQARAVRSERLLVALLLAHRAQRGGFSGDALHRKAMAILLSD